MRAPEGVGFTTAGREAAADEIPVDPAQIVPGHLVVTRFANNARQIGLVAGVNRNVAGQVKSLRCFRFRQASKSWTATPVRIRIEDVFGLYAGGRLTALMTACLVEGEASHKLWTRIHGEVSRA